MDYGYGPATTNNGNVQTQRIVISGSLDVTQNYTYDELNRIKTANESSGANWAQTYGYDRFGNRWVSASTGYTLSSLTPTGSGAFNAANNRLIASGYDAAGNQTLDGQNRSCEYDAENRQTKFNVASGLYTYDGDGRRVKKIDSGGTTVFVYNDGGQLIAEYHSDPAPPAAGGGGTSYLTSDHLGSTRVVTKADGTVKSRYDYLPFGEELGSGIGGRTVGMGYSAADSTKQKFTQKERDSESGLDYFGARYHSSAQGRFTSVDPYNPIVDTEKEEQFRRYLGQPQNWNRYVYVWNNPLKYLDPDGENVYVVTYTTGNSHGDEELRRAAETYAEEIQKAKYFDPKTDTVLVAGVKSHQDLQKVLDAANAEDRPGGYGKVQGVALFSHAGGDGPVFHNDRGSYQLSSSDLSGFRVHWSDTASATLYGCNTAHKSFTQQFANAQGVPTFGYDRFAYFSASQDKMDPKLKPGGPVYLIAADYSGDANGAMASIRYSLGFGRVYPLVRRDPAPKDKPRK